MGVLHCAVASDQRTGALLTPGSQQVGGPAGASSPTGRPWSRRTAGGCLRIGITPAWPRRGLPATNGHHSRVPRM